MPGFCAALRQRLPRGLRAKPIVAGQQAPPRALQARRPGLHRRHQPPALCAAALGGVPTGHEMGLRRQLAALAAAGTRAKVPRLPGASHRPGKCPAFLRYFSQIREDFSRTCVLARRCGRRTEVAPFSNERNSVTELGISNGGEWTG